MCTTRVRAFRILVKIRYQYMSTGWLDSAPMVLKICMKVGLVSTHSPLLAFASPVLGFCVTKFLPISLKLGCVIEAKHWPGPCFCKMVNKYKIEVCAKFQPNRMCTTRVRAFRILVKICSQYKSTGGLVSAPMTLKIFRKVGLVLTHSFLPAFSLPVPGFCVMNFLSVSLKSSHGIETRHSSGPFFCRMVNK
jgi:hypothetical protein